MKVNTEHVGLVRGYLIYSQWRAGCVSIDRAKDDDCENVGVAYTPWHRHDEDPQTVEEELEKLYRCYSSFHETDSCMMGFEYRDYRK